MDFRRYRQAFLYATQSINNDQWSNFDNHPLFLLAPELSDIHVQNCSVFSSRDRMLNALPRNAVVAEVGTQYGDFAEKIIATSQPNKIHIIDIDTSLLLGRLDEVNAVSLGLKNNSVELHEGDSSDILATFPDRYFDWIYIDGDHSYQGVKKDIDKAYPKLKEGGLLVFNDYTHWSPYEMIPYGVPKAVNEFCIANRWEIVFLALDCYFTYQDVAIRKISAA